MKTTLLLLQCGETKRSTGGDTLAALDLYNGPLFQVVRHWFRRHGRPRGLVVRILSAEHGLIAAETRITAYHRKMTRVRASELQPDIEQSLRSLRTATAVFVGASGHYRSALGDVQNVFEGAAITWAGGHHPEKHGSGGIGDWQRQVTQWLASQHPAPKTLLDVAYVTGKP